jgi:type III secretion HrpO family protein
MQPEDILYLGKSTIMLIFWLSMPVIGAATLVGLVIALIQTLIQLQEQTLAFAAKLTVIVVVFFIIGDWMAMEMLNFQKQILTRIGSP